MKSCLAAAVLVAALFDAGCCNRRSPYRYDPFTSPAPLAPPQVSPGGGVQPYGTTIQPYSPGTVQPYGTTVAPPQTYVPGAAPVVIRPDPDPAFSTQGTTAPAAPHTSAAGATGEPLAASPPRISSDDEPAFDTASADWEAPATRSFDSAAPLPSDLAAPSVGGVLQASAAETQSAPGARNPYAHAPDYGWLRGVLERDATAAVWKLRYAPEDAIAEPYGGVVVLGSFDDPRLADYEAGDVVLVTGSISSSPGANTTPTYVLRSIQELRPQ